MATSMLSSTLRRVVLVQPMARSTSTPQTWLPTRFQQSARSVLARPTTVCSFSTTSPPSHKGEVTRQSLTQELMEAHALRKGQAEKILDTVFDSIVEAVGDGKSAKISGFGTFQSYVAKATIKSNPITREPVQVPSKNRIRFKPFKSFKDIVHPPPPATTTTKP